MKSLFQIIFCLIICVAILRLGSVDAQTTGSSNSGNCAVSIDVAIIGEVCILGGLGIRAGEESLDWDFLEAQGSDKITEFNSRSALTPIIISTEPTKLSWIHLQFFIDFSLFNKISEDDDLDNVALFLTDEQIQEYLALGIISYDSAGNFIGNGIVLDPAWKSSADLSYQYITMGIVLKAPWPYFFKPFAGVGLNYESIDVDIHLTKNEAKVTIFDGYTNISEAVTIIGVELFNIEGFLFSNSNLVIGKLTQIRSNPIKLKGKNGKEVSLLREKQQIEYFSWNFTF
jgi:hypothetical protein